MHMVKFYGEIFDKVYSSEKKIIAIRHYNSSKIDEEELRRFGGFESKDEAIEFLKSSNVKEIEVEE